VAEEVMGARRSSLSLDKVENYKQVKAQNKLMLKRFTMGWTCMCAYAILI